MTNPVVGIYNNTAVDFNEYIPKVYHNGKWYNVEPYIYVNGEWAPVGQAGTLMIPFATSSGDLLYTSDGQLFQVRKH